MQLIYLFHRIAGFVGLIIALNHIMTLVLFRLIMQLGKNVNIVMTLKCFSSRRFIESILKFHSLRNIHNFSYIKCYTNTLANIIFYLTYEF